MSLQGEMDPAVSALCLDNQRLVHAMARRMMNRGIEYDDLVGWGMMGLVKAAKGFDPERGFAFSTYAVPLILGEMRRALRESGAVHVARSIKETAAAAMKEKDRLELMLGREPNMTELADALGISSAELAFALESRTPPKPMDALDETGRTLSERLSDDDASGMPGNLAFELKELMHDLPDRHRMLIQLRYFRGMTQAETARVLGVSQVQVSRLEGRILERLRTAMEA